MSESDNFISICLEAEHKQDEKEAIQRTKKLGLYFDQDYNEVEKEKASFIDMWIFDDVGQVEWVDTEVIVNPGNGI